jgi:hypothetical protein
MIKVAISTDGLAARGTLGVLMAMADNAGAEDYKTLLNGIVVIFDDESKASGYRDAVLEERVLKGRLSNLYFGEARQSDIESVRNAPGEAK